MKRIATIILAIAAVFAVISGCSKSEEAKDTKKH